MYLSCQENFTKFLPNINILLTLFSLLFDNLFFVISLRDSTENKLLYTYIYIYIYIIYKLLYTYIYRVQRINYQIIYIYIKKYIYI